MEFIFLIDRENAKLKVCNGAMINKKKCGILPVLPVCKKTEDIPIVDENKYLTYFSKGVEMPCSRPCIKKFLCINTQNK